MSTERPSTTVELWSIRDLIDSSKTTPTGGKQITVPEFQRSLVWKPQDQQKFIVSVKKGYPVGALLVYKDEIATENSNANRDYYILIDGLQRAQALRSYEKQTRISYKESDLNESLVDTIAHDLNLTSTKTKRTIRQTLVKWVKLVKTPINTSERSEQKAQSLIEFLIAQIVEAKKNSSAFYEALGRLTQNETLISEIDQFINGVELGMDIGDIELPVMIYDGDSSELPTIFSRLNAEGAQLSPYELLAAQWLSYRYHIGNDDIIEAIWKKYQALQKEDWTLKIRDQISDESSRRKRMYTLYDYLFGLGQYFPKKFPYLFKSIAPSKPNPLSFNLMATCFGLKIENRGDLAEILKENETELPQLERALIQSARFVQNTLEPILTIRANKKPKPASHKSEQQIMSFVAAAFRTRYNEYDLSMRDDWNANRKKLEKNILMYYLYDILNDHWGASGDRKLYEAVLSNRYLTRRPTENQWTQALQTWFNRKQTTLRHMNRVNPANSDRVIFLKYIYATIFDSSNDSKTYHIEHVLPVEQLQSQVYYTYHGFQRYIAHGPINAVSNLALLDARKNIEKGNQTYKEFVDNRLKNGEITEEEHQKELEELRYQLVCEDHLLPDDLSESSYNKFLRDRFELLKDTFVQVWRNFIPRDPE